MAPARHAASCLRRWLSALSRGGARLRRRELFPCKRLKKELEAVAVQRASLEAASAEIVFLPRIPPCVKRRRPRGRTIPS